MIGRGAAALLVAGAVLFPASARAQGTGVCAPPVASPVACENTLPGSPPSEWEIDNDGDPTIQGYATTMSVNRGAPISFKVKAPNANYRIDVYRLGWYGGDGARRIAAGVPHATAAQAQPACITTASTGLVDCGNWAVSATWTVPASAVSGVYVARLQRNDTGGASHITFVVRDDAGHSDVVVQTSDATWQAYNDYGGNSLYRCAVACPPGNPDGYKAAFAVSYNRPFATAGGSGQSWFTSAEYPMIRFLEANGYDVSYFSQVDTEARGALLSNHRLFISSGHDEYYSATQRANVQAARDAGTSLAFFSGNEMFWKTRYGPSGDGANTPNRTLLSYKDTHFDAPTDPVAWTGTWRDRRYSDRTDAFEPENALTGQSFIVNAGTSRITVPAAYKSLRMWRNTAVTSLAAGQSLALAPGTLGYEWDEDPDNGYRPPGQVRLSSTTVSGLDVFTDYGTTLAVGTATHNLTLHRRPSGALVFGAGTVQWAWGLDAENPIDNPPDRTMRQATVNLFADMGVQPATLIGGLVPAAKTTDTTAPTATISSPGGGSVADGSVVTVSGTATDTGGVVAGVEVSTDGGTTWHPATGTTSWSYSWLAHGAPSTTLKVRATDDSGTTQVPGAGVTVGVTCPCSLFGPSVTPQTVDSGDANGGEFGVTFRSRAYGKVSGIRFHKAAANTGTHVGSLWTADGRRLASATFTGETASGWQTVTFSSPVTIQPDTSYVASYFAPNGHYSVSGKYFHPAPSPPPHGLAITDSGPLRVPRATSAAGNGVFTYATAPGSFPALSFDAANYWVDVVFAPEPAPGAVTGATAVAGGRTSANVTWSAPATGGGPTSYEVVPYVGATAQTPRTVTGSPPATTTTVTGLTTGTTYTFRVRAVNPNGAGPLSAPTGAVTPQTAVAPAAPGDVIARPASQSARVSWSVPAGDGDSPITGYTVTPSVGGLEQAPIAVPATETARTVTGLTNGTAYTFRVTATNAAGPSPASAPSSAVTPQATIFDLAEPATPDSGDPGAVEVGVKFQAETSGTITGIRFHKSAANTGTHVGSLWSATGTRLAQVTFTGESASGWQAATFAAPVPVTAGTTYVASYHAPAGHYAATREGLLAAVTNPPLRALGSASSPNGVYLYGAAGGFPVNSFNASNYWVDVLFAVPAPGTPANVSATVAGSSSANVSWSAPTTGGGVTAYRVTPYAGTTAQTPTMVTGTPLRTSRTVTGLNPGTAYTFRVAAVNANGAGPDSAASNAVTPQGAIAPGAPTDVLARPATRSAQVSWTAPENDGDRPITGYTVTPLDGGAALPAVEVAGDARSVTIGALNNGTAYTFRVTARNAIGTSAASAPSAAVTPRATIFDFAAPSTPDGSDASPVELGVKFQADRDGSITGVRFYKGAGNTGQHVGSLWTAAGTRLAQATFGGESAAGWQAVTFAAPVPITAGTTYVASYHAPNGRYSVTAGGLAGAAGIANGALKALGDGAGGNGVYAYGPAGSFPGSSYNAGNYFVDVLFASAPPPGTPTGVTATAGKASATVSWTAPGTGGAPAAYEVIPYVGAAAQAPVTVSGSPPATTRTVTGLTSGTAYTFRVRASNTEGQGPLSAPSAAVTPSGSVAPGAPTGLAAQGDTRSAVLTWTAPADDGGSAITGYRITPFIGAVAQAQVDVGAGTSARVAGLQNGTAYRFSVAARSAAGTSPESASSATVTPRDSIFDLATPATVDSGDRAPVELGVRFRADADGAVHGIRFYKSAANTGTHVARLWSPAGALLAQATFANETASGWQTAPFAAPVPITAGTTYTASYHAPGGGYSVTSGGFVAGVDNPPLHALANSATDNGVFAYGPASTLPPTGTFNAGNYWVDVLFTVGGP